MAAKFGCEGACETRLGSHSGNLHYVVVTDRGSGREPIHFWYCDAAIADDRTHGFIVEILKWEGSDEPA